MSEISAIRRKGIMPYILPPKIYKGTRLVYNMSDGIEIDYSKEYFTIESLEDNNTISFNKNTGAPDNTFYTSVDLNTWTQYTDTTSWTLNKGDKLHFKATSNGWSFVQNIFYDANWVFDSTKQYNVYGNSMSLLYGDNFTNQTNVENDWGLFGKLFSYSNKLISAEHLMLPATTVGAFCYIGMFMGCTSLVNAPKELPATNIQQQCYEGMFYGCTSLATAPEELPATTLDYACYASMFYGCTSLATAPMLPATTLNESCYAGMFYGCTSLTTAPELHATTLVRYCYNNMFYGCTSLATAPILPATTLAYGCYWSMFQGCTSLATTPALPATTLAENCYYSMFENCASLVVAPELPATRLLYECYHTMFKSCTNLNYIKCLATDISALGCVDNWVMSVAATGTFVKNASMSSWTTGTSGIPSGWTIQTVAS